MTLSAELSVALALTAAHAAEHQVTTHAARWLPVVLFIEPGDTVVWRGMTGHDTKLIERMGPEGAPPWRSELGDEGFKVTLERPGVYLYSCDTHSAVGMLGAIVVGDAAHNLSAIEAAAEEAAVGGAFLRPLIARIRRELHSRSGG